jgi:hypothetical protein
MDDSERFARVALMADSDQETVVRSGTDDDDEDEDEVRLRQHVAIAAMPQTVHSELPTHT